MCIVIGVRVQGIAGAGGRTRAGRTGDRVRAARAARRGRARPLPLARVAQGNAMCSGRTNLEVVNTPKRKLSHFCVYALP